MFIFIKSVYFNIVQLWEHFHVICVNFSAATSHYFRLTFNKPSPQSYLLSLEQVLMLLLVMGLGWGTDQGWGVSLGLGWGYQNTLESCSMDLLDLPPICSCLGHPGTLDIYWIEETCLVIHVKFYYQIKTGCFFFVPFVLNN